MSIPDAERSVFREGDVGLSNELLIEKWARRVRVRRSVLSTTYGHGSDPRFDEFVPEDLILLLCDGDCVVTADTSPLEPDALEYKFYARGVGFFFEVKPEDGESLQLIECNVDPKCDELPEL